MRNSTATAVMAMGCASGIRSGVRLAPWIRRDARDTKHVPLFRAATADQVQRGGLHVNGAGRDGDADRFRLFADGHHVRLAFVVKVIE